MHEACTIHVTLFGDEGTNPLAVVVLLFVERSRRLLERVRFPGGPTRPFAFGDRDWTVAGLDDLGHIRVLLSRQCGNAG